MTEDAARRFFDDVGSRHASNVLQDLPNYLPLLRRYPTVVREGIARFESYFRPGLRQNVPAALEALRRIAEVIPEARSQIIQDLGPILREEKRLLPDHPNAPTLNRLLALLGAPVSAEDEVVAELARSVVVLRQPALLIIGAGMSYDRMPITKELEPLLVRFLSYQGVEDPKALIAKDETAVWDRVKLAPELFQTLFAGRTVEAKPGPQHRIAASLLRDGYLAHIVSFNWDDLIERAWTEQYGDGPRVIRREGIPADGPTLWKLHGDVADFGERWVFPNEPGRVFRTLTEYVQGLNKGNSPPSHAVVVGYGESEPVVRTLLITPLESALRVVRVRPGARGEGSVPSGAKHFFEALRIEIELQKKQADRG